MYNTRIYCTRLPVGTISARNKASNKTSGSAAGASGIAISASFWASSTGSVIGTLNRESTTAFVTSRCCNDEQHDYCIIVAAISRSCIV
jgi:hypothetical protein